MSLHSEPGFAFTTSGPVLVQAWSAMITMDSLSHTQRAGVELGQAHGERIGVLTIIRPGMPLPPEAVRKKAGENLKAARDRTAVSATVIPGTGFAASAYRAAYSTLHLFARSDYPTKVTGSLEVASDFIADQLLLPPSARAALKDAAGAVQGATES